MFSISGKQPSLTAAPSPFTSSPLNQHPWISTPQHSPINSNTPPLATPLITPIRNNQPKRLQPKGFGFKNPDSLKAKNVRKTPIRFDPLHNQGLGVQRTVIREQGGDTFAAFSIFCLKSAPNVLDDLGAKRAALTLPSSSPPQHFSTLKNLKLSCSFLGRNCTACNFRGANHSIKNCSTFFFGDTFFPAMIGGAGDCAPNIRIELGTFDQLREVLIAQSAHGFSPSAGSFALTGLLSHLLRVGPEAYLAQFEVFASWLKTNLKLIAIRILFPFPVGFSDVQLVIIRQFLTLWQGKYMGDFLGNYNSTFALWQPLLSTFKDHNFLTKSLPVPPVLLKAETPRVIECKQEVFTVFPIMSPPQNSLEH